MNRARYCQQEPMLITGRSILFCNRSHKGGYVVDDFHDLNRAYSLKIRVIYCLISHFDNWTENVSMKWLLITVSIKTNGYISVGLDT